MALTEFKVNRCSRRCCVEQRNLRDGEWYYSAVIAEGEEFIRHDFSAGAWTGPPEQAIGWWKAKMPEAGSRKMVPAPDAVLVDLLRRMDDERQGPLRYLLALAMLRRRILRPTATESASPSGEPRGEASDSAQPASMRLQVAADGSEIDVRTYEISRRRAQSPSEALQELLYVEASD